MTITLILTGIKGEAAQLFEITPLEKSGILFETISPGYSYHTEYTIYTSLDIPDFSEQFVYMRNTTRKVKGICIELGRQNASAARDKCILIKTKLEMTKKHVENTNENIKRLMRHNRHKRSLVDGLGNILHFVTGVMDQDDAENIYNRLEQLEESNNNIWKLEKEQVYLIKSTHLVVNETLNRLKETWNTTLQKINFFENTLKSQSQKMTSYELEIGVLEVASILNQELEEIERILNHFISILTSIQNEHLHPLIVGQDEMTLIFKEFARDLGFEAERYARFIFSKMLRVDSYEEHDQLVIKISLPKLNNAKFLWHKIFLLPMEKNQGSYVYDIDSEYIAVNLERHIFIPMRDEEFRLCRHMTIAKDQTILICKQKSPMLITKNNNCLIDLFNDLSTAFCKIKAVEPHSSITPMIENGLWLMTFLNELPIHFITEIGVAENIKFQGQGILRVKTSCTIQLGQLSLHYSASKTAKISLRQPKIDTNILERLNTLETKTTLEPLQSDHEVTYKDTKVHNEDMLQGGKMIEQLEREIRAHEEMSKVKTETRSTKIIFFSVIMGMITVTMLWQLRKKYKCCSTIPTVENIELEETQKPAALPRRSNTKTRSLPITKKL